MSILLPQKGLKIPGGGGFWKVKNLKKIMKPGLETNGSQLAKDY